MIASVPIKKGYAYFQSSQFLQPFDSECNNIGSILPIIGRDASFLGIGSIAKGQICQHVEPLEEIEKRAEKEEFVKTSDNEGSLIQWIIGGLIANLVIGEILK